MPVLADEPIISISETASAHPNFTSTANLFRRSKNLLLVLCVSLSMPIAGSIYILLGGTGQTLPMQQSFRLVGGLISETTSLMVLCYVMGVQGRSWKDLGWKLELADFPRALGLFLAVGFFTYLILWPVQYAYRAYSGHFLAAKSLHSIFGFGVSFLSIAFVCEPILRGTHCSRLHDDGSSEPRRESNARGSHQRCGSIELSPLSRACERPGARRGIHDCFDLLPSNSQDRARDPGSSRLRWVEPGAWGLLTRNPYQSFQ